MPDIIQNGFLRNPENLPWWDALEVQCLVCACTFAFAARTDMRAVQVGLYGNMPLASLGCPECGNGCSVSWMQHSARTACARVREAIDTDGEPPPLVLKDKFVVEDDPDRIETQARERLLAARKGEVPPVTASEMVDRARKLCGDAGE
jgi:hypothetical protein